MDRVYLAGSDEVSRAGSTISSAADTMNRAANNIDGAVDRFVRAVDRLEVALNDHATRIEAAMGVQRG